MAIQGSEWKTGAICPHLVVGDLGAAIDFYVKALGAIELYRSPATPEFGEYASLRIWDSIVLVSAEANTSREGRPEWEFAASPEQLGGTTCVLQVCVRDPDQVYNRALDAGALPAMPLTDMFWGDRYGWVRDPFGYLWAICSINEVLTPEENDRRMLAALGKVEYR